MKFTATPVHGAFIVDVEPRSDERGSFNRAFCPQEFTRAGIDFVSTQVNIARSSHALTLRGMHFNAAPFEEAKFVRCLRGKVHDVAIDIRRDSPTYLAWFGLDLDAESMRGFFIPAGCAHGYVTYEDNCDFLYQMSRCYQPGVDLGLRWNDPAFAIAWPVIPRVIHPRDAGYADFMI